MKHFATLPEPREPLRLIAGGTARERRLLEAAADDVMPPGTPERLEHALAAWAALPAGQRSGPSTPARGARLSRWGIVGGIGGLAVVASMLGRAPGAGAPIPPAAVAPIVRAAPISDTPAAPAVIPAAPAVNPSTPGVTSSEVAAGAVGSSRTSRAAPRLASPSPPEPVAATRPSRRARGAESRGRSKDAAAHGTLLEEARRLDAVRSALGAHQGPAARRELADYRARFPRGELALEADVLEADLSLSLGEPERARTLASKLLARPDAGRYRQRLEQLVERARIPAGSNRRATHMDERR